MFFFKKRNLAKLKFEEEARNKWREFCRECAILQRKYDAYLGFAEEVYPRGIPLSFISPTLLNDEIAEKIREEELNK